MLEASGYVEDWVIHTMNQLRLEGNRSVHMTEVNGNYIAKLEVSNRRMHQHMKNMHDIARYVAGKIFNQCPKEVPDWHEPEQCEMVEHVAAALKGNRDASFYLAMRFYKELKTMSEQKGESRWWDKNTFADKQRDLSYWLEKVHAQGHDETWQLLANCYASKLLREDGNRNAKECFKQALKHDEAGEVGYEFGSYLLERG